MKIHIKELVECFEVYVEGTLYFDLPEKHPFSLSPTQFWLFVGLSSQKTCALKKSRNCPRRNPYVF
jgi:hypothetical protein